VLANHNYKNGKLENSEVYAYTIENGVRRKTGSLNYHYQTLSSGVRLQTQTITQIKNYSVIK
ncbi:MAG: hypothetical protein ORN85_05540, partial [Sediminibacterium sp.]|nr:hypothetical protein [Sediminibacterium sp.]